MVDWKVYNFGGKRPLVTHLSRHSMSSPYSFFSSTIHWVKRSTIDSRLGRKHTWKIVVMWPVERCIHSTALSLARIYSGYPVVNHQYKLFSCARLKSPLSKLTFIELSQINFIKCNIWMKSITTAAILHYFWWKCFSQSHK